MLQNGMKEKEWENMKEWPESEETPNWVEHLALFHSYLAVWTSLSLCVMDAAGEGWVWGMERGPFDLQALRWEEDIFAFHSPWEGEFAYSVNNSN